MEDVAGRHACALRVGILAASRLHIQLGMHVHCCNACHSLHLHVQRHPASALNRTPQPTECQWPRTLQERALELQPRPGQQVQGGRGGEGVLQDVARLIVAAAGDVEKKRGPLGRLAKGWGRSDRRGGSTSVPSRGCSPLRLNTSSSPARMHSRHASPPHGSTHPPTTRSVSIESPRQCMR